MNDNSISAVGLVLVVLLFQKFRGENLTRTSESSDDPDEADTFGIDEYYDDAEVESSETEAELLKTQEDLAMDKRFKFERNEARGSIFYCEEKCFV